MTDRWMKHGKIAERGNRFPIAEELHVERAVAVGAELQSALMAEAVPAETDGIFPADGGVVIGDKSERCGFFLSVRIQKGVDFEFDRFPFEIGSSVAFRNGGGFLNGSVRLIGKADFEIVDEDGTLKGSPVLPENIETRFIVVVPGDDFEFP